MNFFDRLLGMEYIEQMAEISEFRVEKDICNDDKKTDDGTKLMIIETTNGGLYYDLESKLDDAVGIRFAQNFIRDDMLYDVFENLEEVKPEQTNTKRMKP